MKKWLHKNALHVYTFLFPALLFIVMEIQNTASVSRNLPAFLLSLVLLYLSCIMLFTLTGNVFASGVFVSSVLAVFYTVSFFRRMQTGQVFIPSDLHFIKHIKSIAAFANLSMDWRPVVSVMLAIGLNIVLFHARKSVNIKPPVVKRATIFSVSALSMFLIFFTDFSKKTMLPALHVNVDPSITYNEIYETNGALLGFYAIGISDSFGEPDDYGKRYMDRFAADMRVMEVRPAPEVRPNVIVVMSESYWDPKQLPGIGFSEEPVPNLEKLKNLATYGNIVSPTFGGLTSNVEFEFLTGSSMRFTGYGDTPYYNAKTYIDTDKGRNLVSLFRENGYETIGLHTYKKSFFDRDTIYPKLGFHAFIGAEDLPNARHKGVFKGEHLISDEYFCEQLTEIAENAEKPLFLFGITMQNHTPYMPDKYENTHIDVSGGEDVLTGDDIAYIESYAEGVYDADKILGTLYDYVNTTDKPTILLYFGDHLPFLSLHTGIYLELGYIDNEEIGALSPEDALKLHQTPYIAFSNCVDLPESWGENVSPFFLGALLAETAGIELNNYYHFLLQAFNDFQALNDYIIVTNEELFGKPPEGMRTLNMFEAFHFDKHFGEGYLDEKMSAFP